VQKHGAEAFYYYYYYYFSPPAQSRRQKKNYARHTKLQTLHHILSAHLSAIHFVWVGNSKLNAKSKIELDDNF